MGLLENQKAEEKGKSPGTWKAPTDCTWLSGIVRACDAPPRGPREASQKHAACSITDFCKEMVFSKLKAQSLKKR